MARELSDWLDTYITYTDSSESPLSYHIWCGLSVIAGALQRRVYLTWGIDQVIYPNLYVVLVGPSGRTRKGSALGIAKDLLKKIQGVSISPESSSGREAMILAMKRASVSFTDPTEGKEKMHCSLTTFSEELSVFLGQGDIKYLANLTDWYDSKEDWEYETIGRGKDKLQGLCLNLMGATAPDWLQSMIPPEAVGGGFTSRVIFIVEERKRKTVPEHTITDEERTLQGQLVRDLERVSRLAGKITLTPEAKNEYISWYLEQDKNLQEGKPVIEDPRFSGYCERRATHLRKLMILSSASRSDTLLISKPDFDRALSWLTEAEIKMPKTFGGLGRVRNSDILEQVKQYIKNMNVTTRKVLLAKFYRDLTPVDLEMFEKTLAQMGLVRSEITPGTADKVYFWIGE